MNHTMPLSSTNSGILWLFFDVGNTLLDETLAWREQFGRLSTRLNELNIRTTVDELYACYERCCADFAPRQWKAIVDTYAKDATMAAELLKLSDGWRHDLEVPYPGVKSTLAELAKTYRLGIIANQSSGTRDRMAKHGLLEHLSLVIGSAEAGVVKPDPAIFKLALRQADCEPEAAVMVGDRLDNDVRPANLLGMKTVHVRQGGSGAQRSRDPGDVPSITINAIQQLTPLLIRSLESAKL